MNKVLTWVRSNLFTVIFLVVMVACLVLIPIGAGKLNDSVAKKIKDRKSSYDKLTKLEKTSIEIADPVTGSTFSETALVNEKVLDRYREITTAGRADADAVSELALEHNRRGRGVLMDGVFPSPPFQERDVVGRKFHRRLMDAYRDLLETSGAGGPPEPEQLVEKLVQRRAAFLAQTLQKDESDMLEPEEQLQLSAHLTDQRLLLCGEAADDVTFYLDLPALQPPIWDQQNQPTVGEMFEWQWHYWMIEDLLAALVASNAGSGSVMSAPAKRVLSVTIEPMDGGAGGNASASQELPRNYAASMTGRTTNPLYDVRRMRIELVVETTRAPVVLDAIARQNFVTVTDMEIVPEDPYEAFREGFLYGADPVSRMTIDLENVWLRAWTVEFMPDETREMLGLPARDSAG